jgi:hypothetical protein
LAAHPDLFLDQLDELYELRKGIEPQKRQEPTIQLKYFLTLARRSKIEQFH